MNENDRGMSKNRTEMNFSIQEINVEKAIMNTLTMLKKNGKATLMT